MKLNVKVAIFTKPATFDTSPNNFFQQWQFLFLYKGASSTPDLAWDSIAQD